MARIKLQLIEVILVIFMLYIRQSQQWQYSNMLSSMWKSTVNTVSDAGAYAGNGILNTINSKIFKTQYQADEEIKEEDDDDGSKQPKKVKGKDYSSCYKSKYSVLQLPDFNGQSLPCMYAGTLRVQSVRSDYASFILMKQQGQPNDQQKPLVVQITDDLIESLFQIDGGHFQFHNNEVHNQQSNSTYFNTSNLLLLSYKNSQQNHTDMIFYLLDFIKLEFGYLIEQPLVVYSKGLSAFKALEFLRYVELYNQEKRYHDQKLYIASIILENPFLNEKLAVIPNLDITGLKSILEQSQQQELELLYQECLQSLNDDWEYIHKICIKVFKYLSIVTNERQGREEVDKLDDILRQMRHLKRYKDSNIKGLSKNLHMPFNDDIDPLNNFESYFDYDIETMKQTLTTLRMHDEQLRMIIISKQSLLNPDFNTLHNMVSQLMFADAEQNVPLYQYMDDSNELGGYYKDYAFVDYIFVPQDNAIGDANRMMNSVVTDVFNHKKLTCKTSDCSIKARTCHLLNSQSCLNSCAQSSQITSACDIEAPLITLEKTQYKDTIVTPLYFKYYRVLLDDEDILKDYTLYIMVDSPANIFVKFGVEEFPTKSSFDFLAFNKTKLVLNTRDFSDLQEGALILIEGKTYDILFQIQVTDIAITLSKGLPQSLNTNEFLKHRQVRRQKYTPLPIQPETKSNGSSSSLILVMLLLLLTLLLGIYSKREFIMALPERVKMMMIASRELLSKKKRTRKRSDDYDQPQEDVQDKENRIIKKLTDYKNI